MTSHYDEICKPIKQGGWKKQEAEGEEVLTHIFLPECAAQTKHHKLVDPAN